MHVPFFFSLAFLGNFWKKWVNIPHRYCSLRPIDKLIAWLPSMEALQGLLRTPSSPGLVSDKIVQGNGFCFVWLVLGWVGVFSLLLNPDWCCNWTCHHCGFVLVLFCGVFWWYLISVWQLRSWLTSSALDQTRGCYQRGLKDGLCQLLSLGQWALEWMSLE